MIEMLQVDNMEYMASLKDRQFSLAIPDPPYGINAPNMQMGSAPNRNEKGSYPCVSTTQKLKGRLNSGGEKLKNRMLNKSSFSWDNEPPKPEYFKELFRVSKNQIIWGGNYFDLPPTRCVLCWDKCQPWENFSQWEMAWTSFDSPAALFKYSNTGGANAETKIHPTQKPVELYKWILRRYAKPGDKILDTHGGSMSLAIACYDLGFDVTICENDPAIFEAGKERVETHISKYAPASEIPVTANGQFKLL